MSKANEPQFIVAEIVKNWESSADVRSGILCQRFEEVINVNLKRGYYLKDWKLSRVINPENINETIVAVFEKTQAEKNKLAMEIYAKMVVEDYGAPSDNKKSFADYSLRAADIFFEQLEKNK